MNVFSSPTFLKTFAAINAIYLAALAGAACGMYIFSVPIIRNSSSSSSNMLHQFHQLITLGAKYMQGSNRIQGISLVLLTWLLYRHPDPEISERWKYFAAALVVVVQVAWYEIIFIFPTNDRLVEMEEDLERKMRGKEAEERQVMEKDIQGEVLRLLAKWQRWHVGRIIVPFLSTCFAVCGLMF